ncbi:MAG TPA: CDP-alcohol phosphatidyltransferase family protein [Bryobacteraceae bacterium]|jgi:cardiolipin synthase
MRSWLNLPTFFTLLRLALVPFVIEAILFGRHLLALALFAAAAATDIIDGFAARRLHLTTEAGAYLDPVADKCLLSGVFLALAAAAIVPWWFVGIIFARDLYILVAAGIIMMLTPIRRFPPSVWGKVSTFVQILTAVVWMARDVLEFQVLDAIATAMLWPCLAFTVWSGIHYTWRGINVARAH